LYQWQAPFFENGAAAFAKDKSDGQRRLDQEVERLKTRLAQRDEVVAEVTLESVKPKQAWGALTGRRVPHDVRDKVIDLVARWSARTELAARWFVAWLELGDSNYFDGKQRCGKANEHHGKVLRDH